MHRLDDDDRRSRLDDAALGGTRLEDRRGECVVVRLVTGDEIAGFLLRVNGRTGLITLFVAGETVFVPLANVLIIRPAAAAAC